MGRTGRWLDEDVRRGGLCQSGWRRWRDISGVSRRPRLAPKLTRRVTDGTRPKTSALKAESSRLDDAHTPRRPPPHRCAPGRARLRGATRPAVGAGRGRWQRDLALVEGSGRLPNLPPLFHGLGRRRCRRPAGHRVEARLHRSARRRRGMALSALPQPERRQRLRRQRLPGGVAAVWHHGGLRRAGGGAEGARHSPHRRPRGQPHLGPASLVRAEPERPRRARPRLLHLA